MNKEKIFEIRKVIKLTLMKLGFHCDLNGFTYLSYAIELTIINPKLLKNICKNLYVEIGNKYQTEQDKSVERSIRHSIEIAFEYNKFKDLNNLFETIILDDDHRPTVGRFIRLITEYYNLGLYKQYLKKDL